MNTLFLRLEGPMQSWGLRSRWSERDTADAPTKSGVIGLRRDDIRLRVLSDALRMGVRIDLPGTLMRDYHTTGGGRFVLAPASKKARFHDEPYIGGVLSAEVSKGRIKVKINQSAGEPETDVSERFYLADASFRVALQGSAELIEELANAVQRPVWPFFLGRKSCVPSAPVYDGCGQFDDLKTALNEPIFSRHVLQAWERQRPAELRALIETVSGDGNRQYDNIGVPARRIFRPRFVREIWLPLAVESTHINTLEG
ncbi:type I-E CRISPR-associated protein Cas5/CasD [Roseiflexus sp.]|uniref:type I-E CRISPR-associated protein Cas5/CasD n=1 Tax=Roseiflexus sp. TaxID=2562120 RepID=UPI00398A94BB